VPKISYDRTAAILTASIQTTRSSSVISRSFSDPFVLTLLLALAALLSPSTTFAQENSPVGLWTTVSDKTGKATSYVRIALAEDKLVGSVEKLILADGQDPNPLCTKCPDEKQNQPVEGLTILWDLSKDGDEWSGGYVLDPDDGQSYRCLVRVIDDNKKLEVRGYIGFALFGRTQTWIREQ
jgi:uncharacterized protein (DUF2147 family)